MLSLLFWLGQVAVMLCNPGLQGVCGEGFAVAYVPLMLDAQDRLVGAVLPARFR